MANSRRANMIGNWILAGAILFAVAFIGKIVVDNLSQYSSQVSSVLTGGTGTSMPATPPAGAPLGGN